MISGQCHAVSTMQDSPTLSLQYTSSKPMHSKAPGSCLVKGPANSLHRYLGLLAEVLMQETMP